VSIISVPARARPHGDRLIVGKWVRRAGAGERPMTSLRLFVRGMGSAFIGRMGGGPAGGQAKDETTDCTNLDGRNSKIQNPNSKRARQREKRARSRTLAAESVSLLAATLWDLELACPPDQLSPGRGGFGFSSFSGSSFLFHRPEGRAGAVTARLPLDQARAEARGTTSPPRTVDDSPYFLC